MKKRSVFTLLIAVILMLSSFNFYGITAYAALPEVATCTKNSGVSHWKWNGEINRGGTYPQYRGTQYDPDGNTYPNIAVYSTGFEAGKLPDANPDAWYCIVFNREKMGFDATMCDGHHTHAAGEKQEATQGTCKTKGTIEWYECVNGCDKKLDSAGNVLASIEGSLDSSKHEGTVGWVKTTTKHKKAYECCGVEVEAESEHSYGTEGAVRYTCSVCSYVDETKKSVADLADAKVSAKAAIDTKVDGDTATNVVSAADTAKTNIDAATTVSGVNDAKTAGLTAIQNAKDANALAAAKTAAKAAIDTEVDGDTATNVVSAADTAKTNIDAATTVSGVNDAKTAGLTAIQNAKDANALAAAKTAAKAAIDTAVDGDTTANVVSAADTAKSNIDAASTLADVATAKTNGIAAIATAKGENALAAAKESANASIDAAVDGDTATNVVDAATAAKSAISSATTVAAVTTAESNGIKAIQNAKAVNDTIEKIDAIGTVAYTSASKEKIDAARAAYDALPDDQKSLITNIDKLTDAEKKYASLKPSESSSKSEEPASQEDRISLEEKMPVSPVTVDKTLVNNADMVVIPGNASNLSSFVTAAGIARGINAAVAASNKAGTPTATIYTGRPMCFNGTIIKAIQNGKKTVVYYFPYKGHIYSVTIPATVQARYVLERSGFAGPFYVGQQLGTTRLVK